MYVRITTTVTTLIDLETFKPDHSVQIEAEDDLPREMIYAAVEGGLRSTLRTIEKRSAEADEDDDSDDDD